jgi:hypothetical protein
LSPPSTPQRHSEFPNILTQHFSVLLHLHPFADFGAFSQSGSPEIGSPGNGRWPETICPLFHADSQFPLSTA